MKRFEQIKLSWMSCARLFFIFCCTTIPASPAGLAQAIVPASEEPAFWVRFVQMKDVWNHVIDLCKQTPYKNPAEALAAAKAAGYMPGGGNKTLEAVISLFNPEMADQVHLLEKTVFSLEPNLAQKRIDWRFGVTQDEGLFDALITALALEHSVVEGSIAGRSVERLGPNLVVARGKNEVYFAPDNKVLIEAIQTQSDARIAALPSPVKSGLWMRANPRRWPAILGRNWTEYLAIQAMKRFAAGSDVEIRVFPWGDSIQTEFIDFFRSVPVSPVDPAWLNRWEPALQGRLMAQASIGLDPRKPFWNQVFTIATEIERTLPGHERVASIRDRLNIASLLAKVSPETDVYPNLVGLTIGAVTPDDPRVPPTIVATLHTRDIKATQTIVEKVIVPVVRTLGEDPRTPKLLQPKPRTDGNIRGLSIVSNRPMFLFIDGTDVCLVWGARNVAEAVVKGQSTHGGELVLAAKWFKEFAKGGPVHRVASIYPEALTRWRIMMGEKPSPWTDATVGLPPLVWLGRTQADTSRDIFASTASRVYVTNLLSRIPAKPATVTK